MDVGAIIAAAGGGSAVTAVITWLKDRKKVNVDVEKTDVDIKLAYLSSVIDRLNADCQRLQVELSAEQDRSAIHRQRARELEDEIDGVRRSAREIQIRCDELASRLKDLVEASHEKE